MSEDEIVVNYCRATEPCIKDVGSEREVDSSKIPMGVTMISDQ